MQPAQDFTILLKLDFPEPLPFFFIVRITPSNLLRSSCSACHNNQ